MSERRELGIGGGAAECAGRSGAGLASRSRTRNSGRVPGLLCPARTPARCGRQGRTGHCAEPAGSHKRPRSWLRSGSRSCECCAKRSSPPCSPAGHRPRGAAGAGKARLQRPAHRLLPRKGAAPSRDATTRFRPEQKTRRLPLSQLRKEPRTGCRSVPSTLHTPLSPSGKSRALRKLRGRRERVVLEIRLRA